MFYTADKDSDIDDWEKVTVDGSDTEVTIGPADISGETPYFIRVRAVNERGPGPYTNTLTVETGPAGKLILSIIFSHVCQRLQFFRRTTGG